VTAKLSVNVNAIAQLRNRRDLPWPSLPDLCGIALDAGAHGITVHPRPDQRHIRPGDVEDISALMHGHPGKEFNIEGYPTEDFIRLVENVLPQQCTLVPDEPSQSTSDHGWDIAANEALLKSTIARLGPRGIRVSLFIDADPALPSLAQAVGADRVELYTGPFGNKFSSRARSPELTRLNAAAQAARRSGLGVNAGHDLTRDNLPELVAAIPFIAEVSIGHAVTCDALTFGMAHTVRLFRAALSDPVARG
jgi:pyridoxine 5-phosphate synthase